MSSTVTIDTASEPGAWAHAVAHTPALAARVSEYQGASDREPVGARGEMKGAAVHAQENGR